MEQHNAKRQRKMPSQDLMQKVPEEVWQRMVECYLDRKAYGALSTTSRYWRNICHRAEPVLLRKWFREKTLPIWRVIGLVAEHFVGQKLDGFNCHFETKPAIDTRYLLYCKNALGQCVELCFEEETTECSSGWTVATLGKMQARYVRGASYTHRPRKPLYFRLDLGGLPHNCTIVIEEDQENDVFTFSADGGDQWYPSGHVSMNMDYFAETPRYKAKRMVWIFCGPSAVGKSHLAHLLRGKSVYETDSAPALPDQINEDVIVVGNKYPHTVEDIRERILLDAEVHIVTFQ